MSNFHEAAERTFANDNSLTKQLLSTFKSVDTYNDQGRFSESLCVLKDFEDSHIDQISDELRISLWNNIALILQSLESFEDSLIYFHKILDIHTNSQKEDSNYYSIISNMAGLHYQLQNFSNSRTLYEQAFEGKKAFESPPQELLSILCNLALVLQESGDLSASLSRYQQALEIQQQIPNLDPLDRWILLNNMASVYFELNEWVETKRLYEQIYQEKKDSLGEEHEETLESFENLTLMLFQLDEFEKASSNMAKESENNDEVENKDGEDQEEEGEGEAFDGAVINDEQS